jgi:hypothetical protein
MSNSARCILKHSKLSLNYWSETLRDAILITNNVPKKKNVRLMKSYLIENQRELSLLGH